MPPFLPRKRIASSPPPSPQVTHPKRPRLADALDAEANTNSQAEKKGIFALIDSDSESSLSDVDSDDFEEVPFPRKKGGKEADHDEEIEEDEEDQDIEWEEADLEAAPEKPKPTPVIGDLQLTFRKDDEMDYGTSAAATKGKKGPSKREKMVRINTHCMHVQLLLYHNSLRNNWISDKIVQETLVSQLPPQIRKEVEKWRTASGLPSEKSATKDAETSSKTKKKGKQRAKDERNERDWGKPSQRLEPGKPNLSHGDPLIHLTKVLSAYWKKRFAITAPGLRKRGYGTKLHLKQEINSLRNDEHDPEKHGERITDLKEFRGLAKKCEGSRDVGAQLFTSLLRGLGIESRLVASLQPSGYGWTKAEQMLPRKASKNVSESSSESSDDRDEDLPTTTKGKGRPATKSSRASSSKTIMKKGSKLTPIDLESDQNLSDLDDDDSVIDVTPSVPKQKPAKYDRELVFPIYWTEAVSPIDHKVLPVSPLVLKNPVASTLEVLSTFEPRGAKADKGKQVMAYVVAFSPDGSAKDVTVRYLKKRVWPGKTKGFRLPIEKVPIYNKHGKVKKYEQYDWFKHVMLPYGRTDEMRSPVDDLEDTVDLVPAELEKKDGKSDVDTLQSLRASADFVLERFLRREEALRPNAKSVRNFTSGKGDKLKSEPVYRRADVERCLTAESWHKEGRQPKTGENPMKMVPVRAVTLNRKREAEDHLRQTGEKQMQGLYSWDATEYIIPPPIVDGVIPKNSYGNMDCFVPSMVPKGAVHVPLRGTVRICKKLEIDFAEAVTGFEFGNKRAVPVCTGVVVAKENERALRDAWKIYNEEKKIKEEGKLEKLVLDMWRKMIMGLRINVRVNEEYGDEEDEELQGPSGTAQQPVDLDSDEGGGGFVPDDEQMGGGFLLPHEERTEDDLVIEGPEKEPNWAKKGKKSNGTSQYPTPSSMPPPKTTGSDARRSGLRAASESSELSDLSSAIDLTDDDSATASTQDSLDDDGGYQYGGRRGSKQSGKPQIDGGMSSDDSEADEAETTRVRALSKDSGTTSRDEESETSSSMGSEEEYKPLTKAVAKRGRPSSTKTITSPSEVKRGRGRLAVAWAAESKSQNTTPKRRGLRRDSTVVTSPYFGNE